MQLPTIPKIGRLSKKHKITAAGSAAAAAVVLAVVGLEAGGSTAVAVGDPTGFSVSAGDQVKSLGAESGMASQRAISDQAAAQKQAAAQTAAKQKAAADAATAKKKADQKAAADAAAKKKADEKAAADAAAKKKADEKAAADAAAKRAADKAAASRSATKSTTTTAAPAAVTYTNNLDGWIKQSLAVMAQHGIPGSYNGIYRNIIRESSGNPQAINLTDSNAAAGIPSKGLLQVIDPTFQAYHVSGTSTNIYDPVANITAACNYAADKYGSIDNVNSAY